MGSISSLSSEEAVETYREPLLQQSITQTLTSTQPLEELLAHARGIIESFATHEKRVYEYQEKNINLERVITAMLDYAELAGGDRAKRYVSSAIIASPYLLATELSPIATPTIEKTKSILDEGAGNRTTSFRDDVSGVHCSIPSFMFYK